VIGVYFFPLLGKYRTILWLSLVYCAGHACLAAFDDNRAGSTSRRRQAQVPFA
jgi:POT family proton-dependent oligopeptide transporter